LPGNKIIHKKVFELEIFDVVDENGNIIGQATRAQCHGNPDLLHRTAHVLVFNGKQELWLQKRSVVKDIQPDKWDTSVGGHLDSGENPVFAALRETKEEIGLEISSADLNFCYKYIMRNDIESELVNTFFVVVADDKKIEYNESEISDGRYWSREEIQNSLGKGIFTPNFEEEWVKFNSNNKGFFK